MDGISVLDVSWKYHNITEVLEKVVLYGIKRFCYFRRGGSFEKMALCLSGPNSD